jgi:AraC-like DNA-binding protein
MEVFMAYFSNTMQAGIPETEDEKYRPFAVLKNDCIRKDEFIGKEHPLYFSLCDISVIESINNHETIYPVIPDGCSSLVFYKRYGINYGKFCGATDSLKKLVIYPGDCFLIFRFMPGNSEAFLTCDINDMTNTSGNVEDCIRNGKRLLQIARRDISPEWKAFMMSRVLCVEKKEKCTDYLIRFCTDMIQRKEGNVKVSELAVKSGFSERYIGRIFERYIGLSPKTYSEIIRMQRSLRDIFNNDVKQSLLDIAIDCGYFDHAHMNREYHRFLKCSSGTLRKEGFFCMDYCKVKSYI